MGRIVGIDFGTTNTSVAYDDGKGPQIIEMADGSRQLPSVITFGDSDVLVGNAAISQGALAPLRSFRHIKRYMGRPISVFENMGAHITQGDDGMVAFKGPDRLYKPHEFAAIVISAALDAAEAKFEGERPDGVAIGVPAAYNDLQRNAIRAAAELAGIAHDRIWLVEESTAAALMYSQGRKKFATVGVYDWGGGTFDFTIMRAKEGKLEEVGTRGNSLLGGKDVDDLLVRHVLRVWKERYNVDLSLRDKTMPRIRDQAEMTKIELTGNPKAAVRVDFVDNAGADGMRHMNEPITIDEFEAMARATVERTFEPCVSLMTDKGVTDLDEIILVGGMTRVPLVRQMVQEKFGKKPLTRIPPEEVVALGLAAWAAQKQNRGGDSKFHLIKTAALSLWVETLDNVPHLVIPRGETLPAERVVEMTTSKDGAAVVGVHVLEGDADKADANALLARDYPAVADAPAGEPTVTVKFRREEDGSILVTDITEGEDKARIIYKSAA